MNRVRWILLASVIAIIAAFFIFEGDRYLSFEYIKAQQSAIDAFYRAHPWQTIGLYFAIYVAVAALSLPGAAAMTLIGGAVLGFWTGLVTISFASAIGATLAFLLARFLLRDAVQSRYGRYLEAINRGIEKDGMFYLFTLRLIPIFPFFVINLVMGLMPMKIWSFYWVSQLGMLAGTAVFVNAGTQLADLESLSGILSLPILGSFVLLALFPLLARKIISIMTARRVYRGWQRPSRFDRNLVVIGAGSAGLVSAYIAAAVKARVTLIEKGNMGGDCLNTGCVPSKALLRAAHLAVEHQSGDFGVDVGEVKVDFPRVMERIREVVAAVEPHDSVERYSGLGVDVVQGEACITSPWSVEIDGQSTLTARSIVIAAGGRPLVPPIPGLDSVEFLTSDTVWELRELPPRLLVMGGGPIGCELAQAFQRLGSQVTLVQRRSCLLPREDAEISKMVAERFHSEGMDLRLNHEAKAFEVRDGVYHLIARHQDEEVALPFDKVLIALGRVANTKGYGLDTLGIETARGGTLEHNEFMQTRFPNIYVCGDVAGPYQFTHTAAHQAWYAAVNALFGSVRKFRVDYRVIPWATFTEPEIARVGLNEQEALQKGIDFEITRYQIDDLDRAIADGEAYGVVKVLTVPGKDRILGVTIAARHAGDLIAEFVLAMRNGIGLNKILSTIHIYPTFSEANKYVAGEWKRNHAPQRILRWIERYHAWRLG